VREGLLKAVEIAFDFDPFDSSWTDEQRGAGERVLTLLTERLKDEASLCEEELADV